MKKLFLLISFMVVSGLAFAGDYTTNEYFYLPSKSAYGAAERALWLSTLEATDATIKELVDNNSDIIAGWIRSGTIISTENLTDNVGIGTSLPAYKLDVAGQINSNYGITVNGQNVCLEDGTNCLSITAAGWTDAGTNIVLTTSTDNVGIGTINPQGKLHVSGGALVIEGDFSGMLLANGMKLDGDTTRKLKLSQTGGTYDEDVRFDIDTTSNTLAMDSTTGIDTLSAPDFVFKTGGLVSDTNLNVGASYSASQTAPTNGALIQGNVGIGTFSVSNRLQVSGTVSATAFVGDGSGLTGISSGSGINWTSYDNLSSLAQANEFLINDGGTSKAVNWQDLQYLEMAHAGWDGAVEFNPNRLEAVYVPTSSSTSIYDGTANPKFSFGAWIYARSNGRSNLGEIIQKGIGDNTGKGFHVHLYAGNSSTVKIGSNVGHNDTDADKATAADGATDGSVPLNQWVRIFATYNEDGDKKMKTFVNGAEISYASNTAGVGNVSDDTALDLYIGNKKDGSVTFDGYIKDVVIYKGKALSAAEIAADYKGSLATGATALFDFSEGSGQYVNEYFGGNDGQTGTISGSVFTQSALPWGTALRVIPAGNLGIGTSSPSAALHVSQPLTQSAFRVDDSTGDNSPFIINSAGNVGIGTFSPSTNFHVVGGVRATGLVSCDTIDTDANGVMSCGTDDGSGGSGGWTDGGSNVYLTTSSDNVGIGTTITYSKLDVGYGQVAKVATGTLQGAFGSNSNNINGIEMQNRSTGTSAEYRFSLVDDGSLNYLSVSMPSSGNTASLFGNTRSGIASIFTNGIGAGTGRILALGTVKANDIIFGTNNAENVRIVSGGNVGIGTVNPLAKLQVGGDARVGNGTFSNTSANEDLYVEGNLEVDGTIYGDGSGITGLSAGGFTDGGTTLYLTTSSDNVGIGTFEATQKLQVVGTISATAFQTSSTSAGSLALSEATANGSNTITISAPSSVASDRSCTLEDDSTPFDGCISASSSGWTTDSSTKTTTTYNVGIGTTLPVRQLEIKTSDGAVYPSFGVSNNLGEDIRFLVNSGNDNPGASFGSADAIPIYFFTNDLDVAPGPAITIDATGANVGIGTANPEGAFIVRNSTSSLGWTVQAAANQACNTTCTSTCVFGQDTGSAGNIVSCSDATADRCLCAGSN